MMLSNGNKHLIYKQTSTDCTMERKTNKLRVPFVDAYTSRKLEIAWQQFMRNSTRSDLSPPATAI